MFIVETLLLCETFTTTGCYYCFILQAAREKETLRRSYFLFVAAVVTNDVTVVLTSQSESFV